jgi:DNA-binding MarR family transcriptional regulator
MKAYPHLHLNNQLCFALYSASHQISKLYFPFLKEIGLTYPQYLVMMVIWEHFENNKDGILVTEIADKVLLDTGTLSPLLKRMERSGLLRRARSSKDERRVEIFLTDQGKNLREEARHIPIDMFSKFDLSLDELKKLKESVEVVREMATKHL